MSCASVPQSMRASFRGFDTELPEPATHDLPHIRHTQRTIRLAQSHKDIPASTSQPRLREITQDCFTHFVLQRVSLVSTSFCAFDANGLFAPVDVTKTEIGNLAAAQGVDRTKRQNCSCPEGWNCPFRVMTEKTPDVLPRRPFR